MGKQLIIPEGTDVTNLVIAPAVRLGDVLYLSGTTGAKNQKLVGNDIESQARQAMLNLGVVLEAAGSSWEKVVKVNCFLTHVERDFAGWNRVFSEFFPKDPPARTTVSGGIAMADALIEVELIASV